MYQLPIQGLLFMYAVHVCCSCMLFMYAVYVCCMFLALQQDPDTLSI